MQKGAILEAVSEQLLQVGDDDPCMDELAAVVFGLFLGRHVEELLLESPVDALLGDVFGTLDEPVEVVGADGILVFDGGHAESPAQLSVSAYNLRVLQSQGGSVALK